jgi:hypothetical protein
MRQNAGLLSQHVSSISMPIFRSTIEYRFLVSRPGKPTGLCSAVLLEVCAAYTTNSPALQNPDGLQVWTPESGTHYCTPEDGHTNARNTLSQ